MESRPGEILPGEDVDIQETSSQRLSMDLQNMVQQDGGDGKHAEEAQLTWKIDHGDIAKASSSSPSTTPTITRRSDSEISHDEIAEVYMVRAVGMLDPSQKEVIDMSCEGYQRPDNPCFGTQQVALESPKAEAKEQKIYEIGSSVASIKTDHEPEKFATYPPKVAVVKLHGRLEIFPCKLDTGANINVITDAVLDRLGRNKKDLRPLETQQKVRGFGGEEFEPLGSIKIIFHFKGEKTTYKLWFDVVPESYLPDYDALLAEWFIKKHGLI
jgi:hypothetical protein